MKNKKKGKRLVETVDEEQKYVDLTNEELRPYINKIKEEYLKKEGMDSYLNESDAYKYLTPFDWVGKINLRGIFAPVKWLATLLAGATALLLAGLIKALKTGKKQIAIAKVRQWIKGLVVMADGGYKKSRRTKDSLFLIEARARRDILQAAVMSGYAAGLDIPEKNNEPVDPIESAKNESIYLKGLDGFLLENSPATLTVYFKGIPYDSGDFRALANVLKQNGFDESNYFKAPITVDKAGKTACRTDIIEKLLGPYCTKEQNSQENNQQGEQQNSQENNQQGEQQNSQENNQQGEQQNIPKPSIDVNAIQKLVYKNNFYDNTNSGVIELYNAMKNNGEDFSMVQIGYTTSENPNQPQLMDKQTQEFYAKKSQNLINDQNLKNNQKELEFVENCEEFVYNNNPFPNTAEGITNLVKTLKNDGYDLKNPDLLPQIMARNSNGDFVGLKGVDARNALKSRYENIVKAREERMQNILPSHISGIKYENEVFNNTPQDIIKLFNKISSNADDAQSAELYIVMKSGDEVLMNDQQKAYFKKKFELAQQAQNTKEEQDVQNLMNASYNLSDFLPDDNQVDWSLMKTLKKSSWFGLVKHKTNLWKEAQSAYKMKLEDIKDENDRQKYITSLLVNVNAALSKITTPSIARNYANVINQFVTSAMKRSTNGTKQMMSRDNAANVGIKVGNHGNTYESSKYAKLFRDEYVLFEATANNTSRPQPKASSNSNWMDQYVEWKMNQQNREAELEYDDMKPLIDNTFKAMQNIFTANPSSDFLVFVKTRDQMNNFLNELTKSVYVIIESVAKKARENSSFRGNGKAVDNMINGLLSSDGGDPKQNRSLRNLWDNIARPQLDSRAITRCQSIVTSPEFNYFLQMLTVSIPLCIMSVFTKKSNNDSKVILMLKGNGTKFNNSEIISNNTPDSATDTQQNSNNTVQMS